MVQFMTEEQKAYLRHSRNLGTEADPRVRHGSLRTVLLEQPGERQPAQLRHNGTITYVGAGQRDLRVRFKFARRDEA